MRKNSLFSDKALNEIQKTRKLFLKFAVYILIAELILGAILILAGIWDSDIGRFQGTFLIFALVLFLGVNSFIRLEKGNKTIQVFALIGFIASLFFAILACLLMWEVVPANWTESATRKTFEGYYYTYTKYHNTPWAIAMLISAYATAGGFWISNIMSIRETTKIVKPLKITAIICIACLWIFGTIMTPIDPKFEDVWRLYMLAALAGLAFNMTAPAALIISKTNRKKLDAATNINNGQIQNGPKTDAELRAEIEEKIRREMIEKETRAKIETERNAGTLLSDLGDDGDNARPSA